MRLRLGLGLVKRGACLLRLFWGFVRAVSGDAAYDSYLRRVSGPAMSRQAYYLDTLERKYESVSRCC
jgi:hypothetical protein